MTSKTDLIKEHLGLQNRLVATQLDTLGHTIEAKVLSKDLGRSGAKLLQEINRGREAAVANATGEAQEVLTKARKDYDIEFSYLLGRECVGDLPAFYGQGDNALSIHDALVQTGQIAFAEESRIHQLEYTIKGLEKQRSELYKELEAKRGKE